MTNWDRKAVDELADAVGKHLANSPTMSDESPQLENLQRIVRAASHTVTTTQSDLTKFRFDLCTICRRARLYDCDVASGWSLRCAFVRLNTTQFGDLN